MNLAYAAVALLGLASVFLAIGWWWAEKRVTATAQFNDELVTSVRSSAKALVDKEAYYHAEWMPKPKRLRGERGRFVKATPVNLGGALMTEQFPST